MANRILKCITHLLFPPKCIFCNNLIDIKRNIEICDGCYNLIPFIKHKSIMPFFIEGKYEYCDGVICVCSYNSIIRKAIIKFKFNNKPGISRAFAVLLAEKIKEVTEYHNFDMIISVPLHKSRENVRGYNQSLLLAKILSKELCLPEKSRLITRVRKTDTQSLLSKEERLSNVSNAFKVKHINEITNKSVLLVDDIMTTGITLNECSKALKEAGAAEVISVVIASGRTF